MNRPKLGLVCSAGGHLDQLWALRDAWADHERFWVTFDKPDARERLADEAVVWAIGPTNRDPVNAARNVSLAAATLRRERPDVLLTDGAGLAVPWFAVGRAMGSRLVYLEVLDRIDSPSLTGALLAPWVDEVWVQWPEQQRLYPGSVVVGPVL